MVGWLRGTHNPSVPGSSPGGPTIQIDNLDNFSQTRGEEKIAGILSKTQNMATDPKP